MNISIVVVGKIKEKYLKLGIDEFKKRFFKYCKLEIIELDDEKVLENLSVKEMEIIKDKEGKKILGKIKYNSYVIVLVIDGKGLFFEEFVKIMSDLVVRGNSSFCFIIGGFLGFFDEVLGRVDYRLFFFRMIFFY